MKNLVFTALFLISLNGISQENIPFREHTKIVKNAISKDIIYPKRQKLISDSLVITKDSLDVNFVPFLKDKKLNSRYKYHAFGNKNIKFIRQWNVPIRVYFDEQLPKDIKQSLTDYFKKFNSINNLNVSTTKNIENSNYYLKVYKEHVSAYTDKDYKTLTKEEIETEIYSGITYDLNCNYNFKCTSGVIKISNSELKNRYLLSKLKIIFYLSLTDFYRSNYAEKESLLNKKTINAKHLTDYDILLLKNHYNYIYPYKVNLTSYKSLLKL